MNSKPSVISLFCGAGGSSLGYSMSGYNELLGIDINPIACETFHHNFPNTPIWCKDLRDVEIDEVLDHTGLIPEELDLLDRSPPCQGFSMCGTRDIKDQRNDLFLETVRFIEGLRPKVFLIENVTGLMKGKMRGKFNQILFQLKSTGYKVKYKRS